MASLSAATPRQPSPYSTQKDKSRVACALNGDGIELICQWDTIKNKTLKHMDLDLLSEPIMC